MLSILLVLVAGISDLQLRPRTLRARGRCAGELGYYAAEHFLGSLPCRTCSADAAKLPGLQKGLAHATLLLPVSQSSASSFRLRCPTLIELLRE